MAIGFTFPFAKSTGSLGYFEATSTELDAVKQNLRSLLLTNWGERVMHYYFGCNLIEFLFSNDRSTELKQKIADRILDQVGKWMPFLVVDELNIVFYEEDDSGTLPEHGIGIFAKFHLASRPEDFASISEMVSP